MASRGTASEFTLSDIGRLCSKPLKPLYVYCVYPRNKVVTADVTILNTNRMSHMGETNCSNKVWKCAVFSMVDSGWPVKPGGGGRH